MLKIYRALKTNRLSQKFSENVEWYKSITNGQMLNGHNGFDFGANMGEPIYFDCSIAGKVNSLSTDLKVGLGISIITDDKKDAFMHRYWHLKGFNCKPGDIVETGDLIGYADNTGLSTMSHLHRELKPLIRDVQGNYHNALPDNGWFGAIDLTPFFENKFVVDVMKELLEQNISLIQRMIDTIKKILGLK